MGIFDSKTKVTKSPFETNPWEPQQGALTSGFAKGQSAMDNALAVNSSIKDPVANLNATQTGALSASNNFNTGIVPGANAAITAGAGTVGGVADFQGNAREMYDAAGADRTGRTIDAAGLYADNPYLQSQIDASLGDVRRSFDMDRAGINSAAVGTGNINSTRAGAMEALSMDNHADRAAQISSQMRGDAYGQGLSQAAADINNSFAQQAGANAQIGTSAAQGLQTLGQGATIGQGALAQQFANGSVEQSQAQAEIDGTKMSAQERQDIVAKYMATIGGNYGQSGYTSTVTETPSILQQVAGAAATAAGAYAGFKG